MDRDNLFCPACVRYPGDPTPLPPIVCRGMCAKHYEHGRRKGLLNVAKRHKPMPRADKCFTEGCTRPVWRSVHCIFHFPRAAACTLCGWGKAGTVVCKPCIRILDLYKKRLRKGGVLIEVFEAALAKLDKPAEG